MQCGAITDILTDHHYTSDWNSTIRASLHDGGTDVACDTAYPAYMYAAYQNGSIDIADMRAAATNLFRQVRYCGDQVYSSTVPPPLAIQVFALGLMDPPSSVPYSSYGPERVDTAAHRQLALDAALQGIVLLQNNVSLNSPNGPGTPLLPLQRSRLSGASHRMMHPFCMCSVNFILFVAGKQVAVVGPNADATLTLLSNYHGSNALVANQSVLAAMQRQGFMAGFSITTAPGCIDPTSGNASIACNVSAGFADAIAAVTGSDVALVVVGLCSDNCPDADDQHIHESEGCGLSLIHLAELHRCA